MIKVTIDIMRRASAWILVGASAMGLMGCAGQQSALDPAGWGAERIATLFWWMVAGAGVVWLVLVGLIIYSVRRRKPATSERRARLFIIGGGTVVPTLVLAGLLIYGLKMLPEMLAPAPEGSLKITVIGEQWWWRVRYHHPQGGDVELANEIRLPVGEPVEFNLESNDVIHSFWIPALGGKMDMIPGRQTRLVLKPTRTGVFRGVCAEYCGASHALMAFDVVVLEKEEFSFWLDRQRDSSVDPVSLLAVKGRDLFFENGCTACHTVRGTKADGLVGPDLTHVGGRLSLGAGTTPNQPDDFVRWIEQTDKIKPGVHMPHFRMLPKEELRVIAAYLESLK